MLEEFAEFHGISLDVARRVIYKKNPVCKCGKWKALINSTQALVKKALYLSCGNKECHPRTGIARPEHSEKMKSLAVNGSPEYKATLMKPGELFNKEVNSIEFKRKVLANSGIEASSLTEEEVLYEHGRFLSDMVKSREVREKALVSRIENWSAAFKELGAQLVGFDLTMENLKGVPDDDFRKVYGKLHGVQTVVNSVNSENAGRSSWFKNVFMEDLKFNSQGKTTVRTRGGLEADYISLFEDEGVPWSFEELRIPTISNDSIYIPDFVICYKEETFIVEAKGNFYRQDKDTYIAEKVMAGVRYAEERGWKYCMTFQSPKDMGFLNSATYF